MTQAVKPIHRHADKFGGQAYLSGTNITVNQILEQSLKGKSLTELVVMFPQLTVEDIYSAISFAIQDIYKGVSYWRHDGMTPLTQIKGYSEILVGKTDFDELDTISDDQKLQWMSIIHTSSQRGIARWQQMSHWMSKQFPELSEDTEVVSLDQLLIDVVSVAQNYEPTLEINISPYDATYSLDIGTDIPKLLASVIAYAKNTFIPVCQVNIAMTNESLQISFFRQLLYADDDVSKILNSPYSPVATATAYFHNHQLKFDIKQSNDVIAFTIQLPIWTS